MKKLLSTIIVIFGLSGCTVIDAYLMTKYDGNEYQIISEIRADASLAKNLCDDVSASKTNADAIYKKTSLFEVYSESIPRNENLISSSKELNKIAQGLKERYAGKDPVSSLFCKLKFSSIENSAKTIQHVVGGRPR